MWKAINNQIKSDFRFEYSLIFSVSRTDLYLALLLFFGLETKVDKKNCHCIFLTYTLMYVIENIFFFQSFILYESL